ncbi:MAG TPA: AbrB/MazE/SpoVT family DNA-binding domain-containing protein [Candidatus Acidoferrales bacterium]|jgi:AbrB family looped-hinge helix DNA binding protein|nr:AbrB/MazE/SpoVT family DNA-binding domain-containing protein [Candidatus Acidoferrales bacterium]
MPTVTVSPKYQIVIPKELREQLGLKPGQKLFVFAIGKEIYMELPKPITELRGIAKGKSWKDDYRDRRDRF